MGATYSPHRDGGGTLHFPSPTHIHHVDPSSALVQLRRSLSRSPSKGPTFRLVTSKSASPSPSSPLSPSPLSPQHRANSASLLSTTSALSPSPLATPFPPSAKKNRSGTRRLSPPGTLTRSASLHRSPAKRALSDSTDNGNAAPPSPIGCNAGTENGTPRASPEYKDAVDSNDSYFGRRKSDDHLAPHHVFGRRDKSTGYLSDYAAKSSPLKRSDGTMDFDLTNPESPSAKRRSLHGASFSPDFDIFDHEAATSAHGLSEAQGTSEGVKFDSPAFLDHAGIMSTMPKRTSSLRKTTLQQRYEKPLSGRPKPNTDSAFALSTPGIASSKSRQRMSLDNVLPPMPRDSPFSSQGSLPNASVHPISQRKDLHVLGPPAIAHRHPLSRTITQSSSNSSLAEDSPTHVPVHHMESRRPSVDFTKSLPIGSNRPGARGSVAIGNTAANTSSSNTSFATPESYKLAKPLPAAFMSTGLISKRNRDVNVDQLDFQASLASMPDTPCKRPTSLVPAVSVPALGSAISKPRHGRKSLHEFGTPSTPFNPHVARPSLGSLAKASGIFGSNYGNAHLPRRGSFVSTDGEDASQSPSGNIDSQSSTDLDIPPTPTKQVLTSSLAQSRPGFNNSRNGYDLQTVHDVESLETSENQLPQPEQCCKSSPNHTPGGSVDGDNDSVMEDSPSTTLRFRSLNAISSFSKRPQFLGYSRSPTPLSRTSLSVPFLHSKNMKTKQSPLSPASPLFDRIEPKSPQTPQGSMLPPDPSGLSISARGDGHPIQNFNSSTLSFPATPTTSRDQVSLFRKSRASMTPVHGPAPAEVDACLLSRFGKVEIIGTGEFSQVYRVVEKSTTSSTGSYFTRSPTHGPPQTPLPSQVWAVKKTLRPFIGARDRQRKLQEVHILKALGHADHTVELVESWEENSHLYIQTEFCEEGSLDLFLDQVGRKARLDDFRIWKIMLELSLVSSFRSPRNISH